MPYEFFSPTKHGFKFSNKPEFCLSGGMSLAALDYFLAYTPLPQEITIKPELWNKILNRQYSTMLPIMYDIIKKTDLDDGALKRLTMQSIRDLLNNDFKNKGPVPVCLIRAVKDGDPMDNQIIVVYDLIRSATSYTVKIYDPDYANDETVNITVNFSGLHTISEFIQSTKSKVLRGFFIIEYKKGDKNAYSSKS